MSKKKDPFAPIENIRFWEEKVSRCRKILKNGEGEYKLNHVMLMALIQYIDYLIWRKDFEISRHNKKERK